MGCIANFRRLEDRLTIWIEDDTLHIHGDHLVMENCDFFCEVTFHTNDDIPADDTP